ncbi:uncharacterized protein LOC106157656 [Lingula anatina]|uniref:Uncharacterized protein LOC106157656 n=1 Tax=Lingula anatina TaxID=7574 RepID=A0A1S3HS15_LINAN|nr:uncharacterized protein LOC106157656 [Lingula anatina]|eukprot:XP_013388825.1 uncharacterized protein LOC106157656 [Lingula anatina]
MAAFQIQSLHTWILALTLLVCLMMCTTRILASNLDGADTDDEIRPLEDTQEEEKRQLYYPGVYDYWKKYWTKKEERPWEKLPNTSCYRKKCQSTKDCCQRYNICDPYVKICYDCWYKYPCKTDANCCQKYPNCKIGRDGKGHCYS